MMTPSTTDAGDTEAGSGLTALISRVSPIPATMPNAAPTVARAADSARNWRSTSRRRAPSDFRRPISRVRSATDISMMFMITMPPITSDTITTPGRTTTRMRLIPAQNRCTPSDVSSTKLLSWLGRRWRRLRMTPSATSMASRISTSDRAFTRRASTTPGGFEALGRCEGGHDHEAVERESQDAALLLDHADHPIADAADPHGALQRCPIDEQPLGHRVAQDSHRDARAILLGGEGPSDGDPQVLDFEVPLACGDELDVPRFFAAVEDGAVIVRQIGRASCRE